MVCDRAVCGGAFGGAVVVVTLIVLALAALSGWLLQGDKARDMSETNMFDGVTDIRELIGLAIGAGSVCWSNPGGAGEFDSTTAADIVDAAYGRVQMLIADSFSAEVAS